MSKFLGLLERGWDVHVVCGKSSSNEWDHYRYALSQGPLRSRVHVAWPARPRPLALLLLPLAVLRCLLFAPRMTLRYLGRGWRRFGWDVLRRLYLDAEMICLRPALLHVEFGALAPERMYLKELLGCRVIVSFRGYDINFSGPSDPQYYRPVWEEADALHFLGTHLWHGAQRRGCPPEKAHALIPPATDLYFFTNAGRRLDEHEALRILSVGRLEWKKGYEHALHAVKLLRERGVSCIYRIIGDGEHLECLAFARHQLGLEDCVEFLGAQSRETVREQMEWADVFLHPSLSEGFCNAVIEAQAMQLPVVCSDAGGLPENVEDGVTGFIVPRRNPGAMAEKLLCLANDAQLRRRMGEAGADRARRLFHANQQLELFEQLYRKTLA